MIGRPISITHMPDSTTLSSGNPREPEGVPRPTIRDVAALARVGLKTVSRVINGEPGVSLELQKRVTHAIEQLGYSPNLAASSLRRTDGKTATVGTVLENVANPFSAAVQRAVEDVAREHGVLVYASSAEEEGARERALAASYVAHRVDGLIIMPADSDQSYLANERRSGLAVVFVDRPPRFLDADAVVSSNRAGAAAATSHLVAHGHRRIGFIGDLQVIHTAAERLAGYLEGLAAAGIPFDESLVRVGVRSADAAAEGARALLVAESPPTALFTAQNLITEGAIKAIRALGLQRQVAVVGFDDFPMADMLDPAVTVVAQDPTQIGELAARILFRRLAGDRTPTTMIVVPTVLITRGSGELPARTV